MELQERVVDRSGFHLQEHVETLYGQPRQMAFDARTAEDATAWQQAFRQKIREILGIAGRTLPTTVKAEKVQVVDCENYMEEKYALDASEGVRTPMYVLVPK